MKTTVYLNKNAEEYYRRAKEYDPDYSLSDATSEGLKQFVEKMDAQFRGMTEICILDGTEDRLSTLIYGRMVKFIGKKLSSYTVEIGQSKYQYENLYLTKKGKYLYQAGEDIEDTGELTSRFVVCHTLKELREKASPSLLMQAGNSVGEFLEELDV
ncbi:hypothetical protein [Geobacter sulfurreducens]|uniref:hypothetical protein n=1 Tax=Geobacter sulfurreducens TaxID=35554 RepID=UPI000DBB948C|nr:hypothetical protein [Geobacter sulfurreducens]BBA71035.1 hypothetical protein YM18_2517 [Geobacter sulfurreducens]